MIRIRCDFCYTRIEGKNIEEVIEKYKEHLKMCPKLNPPGVMH